MTQAIPANDQAAISLSVLIPNYNYARYIGETIQSVLHQASPEVEIVVTDNASTDTSVDVVRACDDERIRLEVNPCNVGFSANLERAASLARGRRMLLLSSDDRMKDGAIAAYDRLEAALGPLAERAVWGAGTTVIDSNGAQTGEMPADRKLWRDAPIDPELTKAVGYPVRAMPAPEILKRSLELLRTPLPFATTCYPKAMHDEVGGYSGGRLMNPDKWFLWKLLGVADMVYVIDAPLFEYRIHGSGQVVQESKSGALKHLTDQYIATFNIPDATLTKVGLEREALARAFIEQDIALRGLVALSDGNRETARRSVYFGYAAYPSLARKNPKVWLLRALITLGPVGIKLARASRKRAQAAWQAREIRR
ncbi:MAG: glycosyltransferase [Kofleriaceae bacterium]